VLRLNVKAALIKLHTAAPDMEYYVVRTLAKYILALNQQMLFY